MKTWLVTGSSRGLGREIVLAALGRGDQVAATARRPEQLADLAAAHPGRLLALRLDVTDPQAAAEAVRAARRRFGRLDVVVNNAGYADLASVEDSTIEAFRAQVETNLFRMVNVTKAALPVLREQGGGHVITVSSVGDRVGTPGLSAYQSAKWARRVHRGARHRGRTVRHQGDHGRAGRHATPTGPARPWPSPLRPRRTPG